jgi:DNA-binding NtrC family response regulator
MLGATCAYAPGVPELVDALQAGLDDFLCCPFTEADFVARLRRLLPSATAQPRAVANSDLEGMVGTSPPFLVAAQRILPVARSDAVLLIGGETGVGKELFARAVHRCSSRRSAPFLAVNCSGLPEHLLENELFGHSPGAFTDAGAARRGLLAEAEGGTLFLDEVDTLTAGAQAKLLRFLQDRTYRPLGCSREVAADVRIIAATNADLSQLVRARQFRQDLFHRLDVLRIDVPPLRARAPDIPLLVAHFLARYGAQYGRGRLRLTPAARRKLLAHAWPGNVRELEGALHRAVVFSSGPLLDAGDIDLPAAAPAATASRITLRSARGVAVHEADRAYLERLLAEHRGNLSQAARASGSDRRTLQRLLHKHGIARSSFLAGS